MPRLALVIAALAALLAGHARGATWQIDPAHTSVEFAVRHMTISNVRGEFRSVSGTVQTDDRDLSRSKIQASIDAASVDTREPKRDEHLKSPDFLDVAKYPTITFVSKRIEPAGAEHWKVIGDLTLHGTTREVVLDVEGPTAEIKDPRGSTRAGAHATAKLNRKDFGITWSKTLDGGGVVVGDEINVTIEVEGVELASE